MKISKTDFALVTLIAGVMVIFMNFFNLIDGIGSLDHLYWPFLIFFLIILSSNIDRKSYSLVKNEFPFIQKYTIIVIPSLMLIGIGTLLLYPQEITRIFREIMPYLMFLLVVPMLMYIVRKRSINGLLNIINAISLIWFFLIIIQRFVYQNSGVIFFSSTFEYGVRDGIRITLSIFGNLSLILNFHQLWYVKRADRCKFSKLTVVLGFFSLIVIQQTRALTLAICLSCLLMVLSDTRRDKHSIARKWMVVALIVGILFFTEILHEFFITFSENSDYGDTTTVRIFAMEYYYSIFKRNPLFGFGFASVANYNSLIRGPYDSFFLNDVGFVGQLARLGLFIIPIYIWPIIRFARITFMTFKSKDRTEFSLLLALLAFMIFTSISVIMIDPARSMGMPIYFAIFEYQHYKNRTKSVAGLQIRG